MEVTLNFLNVGGFEILILLIPAVIWLWAIIDLLRSDFSNGINKIVWAIIIIFVPFLGAILYLILGRSQKLKSPQS